MPHDNSSQTRLNTIPETAKRLKVSEKTIWRLIKRGELGAHRVGRSVRPSDDDIEDYLEKNRIK